MATAIPNAHEVRDTLKKILKNLECPICLELLSNPYTTAQCSHSFCKTCIFKFIASTKVARCPLCKEKITKRSMVENTHLGEIVEAVKELELAVIHDTGIQKTPPRPLPLLSSEATGTPGVVLHSLLHPSPHKPHTSTPSSSTTTQPSTSSSASSKATTSDGASENARLKRASEMKGASEVPRPTGASVVPSLSTRSRMRRVRFSTGGKGRSAMKFPTRGGKDASAALLEALETADFCSVRAEQQLQHDTRHGTSTAVRGCDKSHPLVNRNVLNAGIQDSKVTTREPKTKAPDHREAIWDKLGQSSECGKEINRVLETPALHLLPVMQATRGEVINSTLMQEGDVLDKPQEAVRVISQVQSMSSPTLCIKETQFPSTVSQASSTPHTLTPSPIPSPEAEDNNSTAHTLTPSPIPPHISNSSSSCETTQSLSPPLLKTPAPVITMEDKHAPLKTAAVEPPPSKTSVSLPPSLASQQADVSVHTVSLSLCEASLSPSIPLQDGGNAPAKQTSLAVNSDLTLFPDTANTQDNDDVKPTFFKIEETQLDSVQSSQPSQEETTTHIALPGLQRINSNLPPLNYATSRSPPPNQPQDSIPPSLKENTVIEDRPQLNRASERTAVDAPLTVSVSSTQCRPSCPLEKLLIATQSVDTQSAATQFTQCEGFTGQATLTQAEVTTQQVVDLHQLMASKEREIRELEALLMGGKNRDMVTETGTAPETAESGQTRITESAVADAACTSQSYMYTDSHCKLDTATRTEGAAMENAIIQDPQTQTNTEPSQISHEVSVVRETVPDSLPLTSPPPSHPTEEKEEEEDTRMDIPPTPVASSKPGTKRKSPNSDSTPTGTKSLKITPPNVAKEGKFPESEYTPIVKAADRLIRELRSPPQVFLESQSMMEIDDDLITASITTPSGSAGKSAILTITPSPNLKGSSFKTPKSNSQIEKNSRSLSFGKRNLPPPSSASSSSSSSSNNKPSQPKSRSLHVTPVGHTGPPIKRRWRKRKPPVVMLDSQDDLQTESPPTADLLPQPHPFLSISTTPLPLPSTPTTNNPAASLPSSSSSSSASSKQPPCRKSGMDTPITPAVSRPTLIVKDCHRKESPDPAGVMKTPLNLHSAAGSGSSLVATPALQLSAFRGRAGGTGTTQQTRTLSFIGSGLTKAQLRQAQLLARQNGGRIASCFNGSTTHVIVISDENGCCPRTVKYLQGVAAGTWVVGFQWVLDSLEEKGCLLPEGKYEVKGDHVISVSHAPKRSRTNRATEGGGGLFANCSSLLAGDFKNVSSELLTQLFSLGGGSIETAVPDLKKLASDGRDCYVVCDDPTTLEAVRHRLSCDPGHAPRVVGSSWLLDSLSSYRLH